MGDVNDDTSEKAPAFVLDSPKEGEAPTTGNVALVGTGARAGAGTVEATLTLVLISVVDNVLLPASVPIPAPPSAVGGA